MNRWYDFLRSRSWTRRLCYYAWRVERFVGIADVMIVGSEEGLRRKAKKRLAKG